MRSILILLLAAAAIVGCSAPGATAPTGTQAAAATTPSATDSTASTSTPASSGSTATAATSLVCTAPATLTIAETEGPYFTAGSPETSQLFTAGDAGTRLTLTGYVVDTSCTPIANALVDVWQADASGSYDNSGYGYRGHVLTAADGSFTFETVVPGEYPGRTPHIHVKVTPPGGSTLTTQVFMPGVASNDSDSIFDPSLLLDVRTAADGSETGSIVFVV